MLAAVCLLLACGRKAAVPGVTANGESLQGEWGGDRGDVAVFRGVPFAQAPVGDLRWRAPRKHVPRAGLQKAAAFAAPCVQGSYSVDWYVKVAAAFGHGPEVVGRPKPESEDCLYLNVWTPKLDPAARLPVMVFVHGGANKGGWSYEPNYVGDRLAARGAVVVTIAYRLGPFGFFAHPALDNGPGEAAANFGLLDMREAFVWVRANARQFGGDPDRITGFGESAGAGNLLDLALAFPDEEPVVRRLIMESTGGGLDGRHSLDEERAFGSGLVAAAGLEGEVDTGRLRGIPAAELLKAAATVKGHYPEAVVDGLSLREQPSAALRGPRASRLEILAGTNRDEWLMYVDPAVTSEDVDRFIAKKAPESADAVRSLVARESPLKAMDRLETASLMLCPTLLLADAVNAKGGKGFVYYFTRQRSGAGGDALGAYHGTELPYVFDQHDAWMPTLAPDRALTAAVMDYWVAFASSGAPQVKGLPEWPAYTAARPHVMELGEKVAEVEPPDAGLCRYLGPERDTH